MCGGPGKPKKQRPNFAKGEAALGKKGPKSSKGNQLKKFFPGLEGAENLQKAKGARKQKK